MDRAPRVIDSHRDQPPHAGPADAAAPARVDLAHLPAGAEHFLGRGPELAALDAAWAKGSGIAVVELIAPGGTGKTALVKRWFEGVKARGWGGAVQVYGWSFYSQGTGDDRQASEDHFLASAIERLGVAIAPSAYPADKGQALADRLATCRTLLILDGLEPLQHPPGPMAGELRAPGLKTLLTQLAAAGHPGLCVVTSREGLQDLGEWVRGPANPQGGVLRLDLGNLSDADGAALLHARGATRAGEAEIGPDDPELIAVSQELDGHALALSLLGRYLARAKGGDIRQRDAVNPARADRDARGHAARVVAAYETWFAREGLTGADSRARELAALRLLGLFDRPATRDLLDALRAAPPIPGLTEPLQELTNEDWTLVLANLADCGLIHVDRAQPDPRTGALDAHPLVREYLAAALAERCPDGWREGHRRIYERLKASAPHRPEGLDGLQPLYQAVVHGCRAGLWQEACDAVYIDRILRGMGEDGFYSTGNLGAFGTDLGAVACLFAEPWSRPAPALVEAAQAWLLNLAAFNLRALGRLGEALEPMRAGAEIRMKQEDCRNAARVYGNLSELQLTLGRVLDAVADGERAVGHADRSGDAAERMINRTTLADALHQRGETEEARRYFAEAEAIQAHFQPEYPLVYSLPGFRYCDLLLAGAERAAWVAGPGSAAALAACGVVMQRAGQTPQWAEHNQAPLLTIALDQLTLARCALYADRLQGRPPGTDAQAQTEQAVSGLHAAGEREFIVSGLLTRAWLRHTLGDPAGAQSDLAEAERIASRGGMQLHLADCALHRARLFRDRQALAQARRLIESCHYGRRLPELTDAERAAATWPPAVPDPDRHPVNPTPEIAQMPETPSPNPLPAAAAADLGAPEPPHPAGPERSLVYISYSHQDPDWHRRLRAVLDAHPAIKDRVWDDTKLRAGRSVTQDIRAHVPQARVMIMLGSPDYFAPGCGARELETLPALADWQRGELDILWLRVREHPIAGTPVADIMAANGPGAVPLDRLSAAEQDAALRHLRDQVLDLIGAAQDAGTPTTAAGFDCFLSHNSSDKPRVRELARALADHGLSTWLDEEQLRPGLPWQPLLEQGIRDSAAVAVCIAADGLGPWQDAEMQAALQLAVRNPSQPVMAVLLPGAPDQPALPAFLSIRGWVDLRAGICGNGLDRLVWGIVGHRPGSLAPWPDPPANSVAPPSAPSAAQPARGSALPQPAAQGSPTYPRAAATWREKLDFLLEQEALTSNPAQRFELSKQIAECRARLRELGVEP